MRDHNGWINIFLFKSPSEKSPWHSNESTEIVRDHPIFMKGLFNSVTNLICCSSAYKINVI